MLPIDNLYLDNEYDEVDDEFTLLSEEYGEDYAEELLTNLSREIFEKVIDYIVPFKNALNNPNSDKHNKIDVLVLNEFKHYINRLLVIVDGGNTPIKELEIVSKTLDNLLQSINFDSLHITLELEKNAQLTSLSPYQVACNIFSNVFVDLFNAQVRCYLQDNNISLD